MRADNGFGCQDPCIMRLVHIPVRVEYVPMVVRLLGICIYYYDCVMFDGEV